jgi:hypothetical protein
MKLFLVLRIVPESRIIISVTAFLSVIGQFSPMSFPRGCRKNLRICTMYVCGFRCDISKPQEGSCKRFQGQNHHFRDCEEDYWKDFYNKLVISYK